MIDYCISAYDEDEQLDVLIAYLKRFVFNHNTIIVVLDCDRFTNKVKLVCDKYCITPLYSKFDIKHLSSQVEFTRSHCNNEFLFLLSADETPDTFLLTHLQEIFDTNVGVDGFSVPRINIISNLTPENVSKMYVGTRGQDYLLKQRKNEHGWIEWPDYQARIVKNVPYIGYGPSTHSGMVGFRRLKYLPAEPRYSLHHIKTVEKQSQSNRICDGLE